jgi:hypothetical protein
MGFIKNLFKSKRQKEQAQKYRLGMEKTRQNVFNQLDDLLQSGTKIDEALFEDLEEIFIMADMGVDIVLSFVNHLRETVEVNDIVDAEALKEIIVEEKGLSELRELGYNLKRRRQSIGFGSTLLGTEIGAHINIDKETVVEKAFFIFNRSRGENLLFRVNLYQFDGETVGANLIPENVIIESPDSARTVSVDLSKYNIVTSKNLLLSLEWVDAVNLGEDEVQGITFRADESRRGSNTYLKTTSFAPFIKTDSYVKYRLGFYLTVRQEE